MNRDASRNGTTVGDDDIFNAVMSCIFPVYAIERPSEQRKFIQFVAERIDASTRTRGMSLLRQLVEYARLRVVVVDDSTDTVLTTVSGARAVECGAAVACNSRDNRRGQAAVTRLNRSFRKEEQKVLRQQRLRKFLRTGLRSEIEQSSDNIDEHGVKWVTECRTTMPVGKRWSELSCWHRVEALQRHLRHVNERVGDDDTEDDVDYVRNVRRILAETDDATRIRAIRSLVPPYYDPATAQIIRLAPKSPRARRGTGGERTSARIRKKPQLAKSHREIRRPAWGNKSITECRRGRKLARSQRDRTVRFTGDFVQTNGI